MDKPDKTGERIAKVLARRGVASRRVAETMIVAGRIAVNGKVIATPALNVGPRDRITVDGKPLAEAAPSRLWLYYKPVGLVTTEKDEKDRPTVFAALPPDLGRVVSVGRLDLNSEGLLLLTNDGVLKRRLELPSTGWLRKYRVRINGSASEAVLEPLRKGLVIDGERFLPMEVSFDRQQGANAWLTVGLREGKNREVRRAMEAVGLVVNRLIRVSYGPFRLGELKPGEVEEVRPKVLRDQLGAGPGPGVDAPAPKPRAGRPAGRLGGTAKGPKAGPKSGSKSGPGFDAKPAAGGSGRATPKPASRPAFAADPSASGRRAGASGRHAGASRMPGGGPGRGAGRGKGPGKGPGRNPGKGPGKG